MRAPREAPDEGPSDEDIDRFGGVTQTCPKCRAELYDDAAVCWKCGHALMSDEGGVKPWVLVTVAVLIIMMVVGLLSWR